MEDDNREFRRLMPLRNRKEESKIDSSPNKMKISQGTIISVLIVLATLAAGGFLLINKNSSLFIKKGSTAPIANVQLKFGEKNFKLDYSSLDKNVVVNIAAFEKDESWQGEHELDETIVLEGQSSLLLTSKNNSKIDAYLSKKSDFSRYQVFNLAVYLQSDITDVESVKLYFANKDKTAYFSYPLTSLVKGWNYLRIPKIKFSPVNAVKINLLEKSEGKSQTATFNWDKVERVGIEVNSRANSSVTLNFDNLFAVASEDYLDDWLTLNPLFLDLVKIKDDKIVLQAKNVIASSAVIKEVGGGDNFNFKAKVQPLKTGMRSGLFIRGDYKTNYGYYFFIDGLGGNRWQIYKAALVDGKAVSLVLKNGVVNNFIVEENKPLWLKVEVKGSWLKFLLSPDDKTYTTLGEVSDSDIKTGGLGIAVFDGGMVQFDNFEFNQ